MGKKALVRFKDNMQNSAFLKDMNHKIEQGKDIQIVIVGRNAERGLGKTTLAILLCKILDRHGWDHSKGTVNFDEYKELYHDLPERSAILLDEMELMADSRRALSKENVQLSQVWSMFRYRQMITIGTIPSADQLDKRMKKLSSGRITVVERGLAFPYKYRVDDFSGIVTPLRYRNKYGMKEQIRFFDLDGSEDYKKMHEKKVEATKKWMESNS